MTFLSPTVCIDFLTCPRHFAYKRMGHHSLVLPPTHLWAIQAGHVIQHITAQLLTHVFHTVDIEAPPSTSSFNQMLERYYQAGQFSFSLFFTELEEQVLTFFRWFFEHFCFGSADKTRQVKGPLLVYERIAAPSLGLIGQPSAVFEYTDQSVLILIETYRPTFPFNDVGLQVAMYERILTSQGYKVRNFLFVNYQTSELIIRGIHSRDHAAFDITRARLEASLLEHDFAPPVNPPCKSCEFEILCAN